MGIKTTKALVSRLHPFAAKVDISAANNFKAINQADLSNYDYIISPEIYHWEDRATNMSYLPDKMILGLTIYDNTGNVINYLEIKGESTKVTMASNDPIELVNEALDLFIRSLFNLY